MCGNPFSKPKVDNSAQQFQQQEAERARREEERRSQRIELGLRDLDAIFDGGTYSTGYSFAEPAARPAVERVRTAAGGSGGAGGWRVGDRTFGTEAEASAFAASQAAAGGYTPTGTATSAGFEPFLADRKSAFMGYYTPQLDRQFGDARDDLAFALARAGQLTSTTAAGRQGDLQQQFELGYGDIVNRAAGDQDQMRSRIADARASLENTLRATGDATAATNDALSRMAIFANETPRLDQLGPMFAAAAPTIGNAFQTYQNRDVNRRLDDLGARIGARSSGRVVRA